MATDVHLSRARSGDVAPPRHTVRRFTRRGAYADTKVFVLLILLGLAIVVAVILAPNDMPFTSLMVPLLLGSLLLNPRHLPWFVIYMFGLLMICLTKQDDPTGRTYAAVGIQVLMCLIVLGASLRRSRLGVAGTMGESMFVDLRDRILQQGGVPDLPRGWLAESALRSAGGTAFAGDFVVATLATPTRLELAVIDVSGKGEEAGTRALLLSGAFGGLLGALPAEGSSRPPTTTCSARTGPRASPPPSTSPSTSTTAATRSAPPATRRRRCARPAPAAGAC